MLSHYLVPKRNWVLALPETLPVPPNSPFLLSRWKITLVGSRFTRATESRYAPVEGETLAAADALEKARYFVLGCDNLIIAVDNKPLKLLGDRSLENIPNARLKILKEKTLRYRFQMMYVPGPNHRAADAVSRHPTGDPETKVLIDDVASISPTYVCDTLNLPACIHINNCNTTRDDTPDDNALESILYSPAVSSVSTLQSVTWDKVRTATSNDDNMLRLVKVIEAGIPDSCNALPLPLREYYPFRDQVSTVDCVAIFKDRIVIPPSLRQDILTALHAVHQT